MDLGLTGKVAIITGGGEGIGRATAQRIATEGGNVVIIGRRAAVIAAAAADINQDAKGKVVAVPGDITNPADRDRLVATALERFGRIDILVNNAGTSRAKPFEAVDLPEWQEDFDLKMWSAIALTRAVLPHMREQGGGRIVNVTNIGARAPRASSLPTTAARAAGIAWTKAMSHDLAPDNILVNTVLIGLIKSGQHQRRFARTAPEQNNHDALYDADAKQRGIPLGRVGEAHEAGDVIAFLVSERASYITGVAINIDGGMSPVP